MRWESGRRSRNVEDRRGRRGSAGVIGGGLGAVVALVAALFFGVDLTQIDAGPAGGAPQAEYQETAEEAEMRDFVTVVLAETETTWQSLFQQENLTYQEPVLVLFAGAVQSACGFAQSAVGPFYCPLDSKVYLDLSFFAELQNRFGAPGDFARAYVVAHEVGHHVQNLLGISSRVQQLEQRSGQAEANALSVRLELQADCFSGVWAHNADQSRQILEAGDIEEGLGAASAVGDDRLQQQGQGQVVPESFTHGTSAQRMQWFQRGLESGSMEACDTFKTGSL